MTIIGVMGGAHADDATIAAATELGRGIAENGWVLLNGGRNAGVMAASARGASHAGGLVVGILPGGSTDGVAPAVDIAIPTGLGDARNAVNVLASSVVIAMRGNAGTVSEIALALKAGRTVVTCDFDTGKTFDAYRASGQLIEAWTPAETIAAVHRVLAGGER